MQYRLQKEMEKLKKNILTLGALVEQRMQNAVTALNERDIGMAKKIVQGDYEIDHMEVELEEECLKLLALHQPVAIDLRFLIATLKINNDLERIGDLVVNICERVLFVATLPKPTIEFRFREMSESVKKMLKMSLDSLVTMDADLAREVCSMDEEVDAMNRDMYKAVEDTIDQRKNHMEVKQVLHLLSISRHLERIADLATNIAEDVVYMIDGRIIRHMPEAYTD